jgi:hypothetical protein
LIPLLELLRSLGFGALFGAGNAGLVYTVFPHLFEGAASLQDLLIVGGLIGGGHRAVDTYIIGAVHRGHVVGIIGFGEPVVGIGRHDQR